MENRDSDIRRSDIIAEEASVREYESTPNARRLLSDSRDQVSPQSKHKNKKSKDISPSLTTSTLGEGVPVTTQKVMNAPAPKTSTSLAKSRRQSKGYATNIYTVASRTNKK